MGNLVLNIQLELSVIEGNNSFPFAPSLLSIISILTGLDIIDAIYIPIIQIIGLFSLLVLTRIFFNSKYSLILTLSIFLYTFALNYHFVEYNLAEALLFLFICTYYKYLTETKNKSILALITILLYITIKFYGPPVEMWALSFICISTILYFLLQIICNNQHSNANSATFSSFNLLILCIVIFLAYNPKFYDQLLYREIGATILVNTLGNVINSILNPQSTYAEFEYVLSTPMPLKVVNILYHIISLLPAIFILSYNLLSRRNILLTEKINNIFFTSLMVPFIVDFVLYASLGLFVTRYLTLIYPLISSYLLKAHFEKSSHYIIIILMILGVFHYLFILEFNEGYKLSGEEESKMLISHLEFNTNINCSILMDHRTYGFTKLYFAKQFTRYDQFLFIQYTNERYANILGLDDNLFFDFDFLLVNVKNKSYPLQVGPPTWMYFEPLNDKYSLLRNNVGLNKIYQTQSFEIYQPNTINL
ncbi:hypothetical protein [Methanolobus chelungpuianus]|uniref:hypothetical protein n=1 Tax=Methanolobus chelungpuianus TaxID=502115 RepID=UPI002113EEE9|nr:hypothetical protein [Methanolobus chelungpuianus]